MYSLRTFFDLSISRLFLKLRMLRQRAGSTFGHSGCWHFFSKPRTAVYPSNKARIGAKLWENAFRTICNFSFFDAQKKIDKNFWKISGPDFRGRFQKSEVLEGLRIFNPRWQMRRQKLLPVVRLFLGSLPWRRGKQPKMCFGPGLGTENDLNHLVLWSGDNMII